MNPFFPSSKPKQKKQANKPESPEVLHNTPSTKINSIDVFRVNPSDIGKDMVKQGQESVTKAWEMMLGINSYANNSGDMQPGVEVNLAILQQQQQEQSMQQEQPQIIATAEHSKYVQEIMGETATKRESYESEQKIESLVVELRKLASSVQAVEKAVVLQAIGPANAAKMKGKYYENFFEWMLLVVQDARRKVEDSGAWLQTMTAKSKGKVAVGKMKHSMNQFLSGERTAQNQSG